VSGVIIKMDPRVKAAGKMQQPDADAPPTVPVGGSTGTNL
jgi:hypothetical protein